MAKCLVTLNEGHLTTTGILTVEYTISSDPGFNERRRASVNLTQRGVPTVAEIKTAIINYAATRGVTLIASDIVIFGSLA